MIILGDMHPSSYISGFIFDDVVGKTGILRFRLYIATQWLPFLHKKTKLEAAASSRAEESATYTYTSFYIHTFIS